METQQLSFDQKYQVILEKDTSYEGIFFTAVKTTGIFCRPSCRARKPKKENVSFYDSIDEALLHGYRPCKLCKPMQSLEETPLFIQKIIKELDQNPFLKIKDYDLVNRGLAPNKIRRWFKEHYNMTFHGYQRMLRINSAFTQISKGNSITDTAFGAGYESLSGFNDSFQNIFGDSPSQSRNKNVIQIKRFTTPLGPMFACATGKGICLLEFTNRKMLETEFNDLRKRLKAAILPGENKHIDHLEIELTEYFNGKRKDFTVSLDPQGTDFQQSVWKIIREIPYGKTWSYQDEAIKLNKASAIRAVASANGMNKISILIPCHRVIGKDGALRGYGGGLARKRWLLNFEETTCKEI